jgi:hypothetical protein
MVKNSREVEKIDEAAMLRSIYERDNPPAAPPQEPEHEIAPVADLEPAKEENRTKRAKSQQYESLFIRESDLPPARFGKSVYIRKEHHDRIAQIVTVIGGKEVSLFGYIDNVLTHHFDSFDDEITMTFKKKIIFK